MDEYHVFVSNNELSLIQRDIINDFLEVEDSLQIEIDMLAAKLNMVVKLMKITQHKNLDDLEYIYLKLKTSNKVKFSPDVESQRKTII